MKDVIPRYWTMRGYRVDRVWGWDCHGLPIENIAEKELGITHKKEIIELGIDKFNTACRSRVLDYVKEWEMVIRRLGRWADMKNAYKTMDLSYMESVWWVFKQLWDRGLIYEDYRAMHICPRCETTLSQSEVSEGYKLVKDLSVIVKFKITDQSFINTYCNGTPTSFLAWTTTPWSIPSTMGLAVGADYDYVVAKISDEQYIFAKERTNYIKQLDPESEIEIMNEIKGKEMLNVSYLHPFAGFFRENPLVKNNPNVYKTYPTDYVSVEDGTGIVTINGAFGEIDMEAARKLELPIVLNVKMDGTFTEEMGEFAGVNVKPINDIQQTDVMIMKYLAKEGALFAKEKYEHSYPHCWRCDTPLLNYATSSWFVKITAIKDEAIEKAKKINWSPKHIKDNRFGKWLEGARDWSISRQRFWASVIPIWKCSRCNELLVFGSISDLETISGQKVTDLHKDMVDNISFPCKQCGGVMKRIPDVLDTWFDSGSMPYAQIHYPFENKDKFSNTFPAEFIAEGIDQTRAWFYYLHSIATAIFESPAYKNVVVNGIVLAEDGKKMSKRFQNYPDPMVMFDKYGADVMRFYLLSSPVMMAENLNFKESEMAELYRGMFRMLWNSYSFFTLYANIDKWEPKENNLKSENFLDKWILSELNILTKNLNLLMNRYELMQSTRLFAPFIDNLSNWYIRRSRKRFWKSENDLDKEQAYQTLWTVLVELSKLMAPFTPFIADEIYKNLTSRESVHLSDYPQFNEQLVDNTLNQNMNRVRGVVEKGLAARAEAKIKVRQPLRALIYGGEKLDPTMEEIILEEVNVKEVRNNRSIDKVELDLNISEELKKEGLAREIIRNIQSLRKKSHFNIEDRITVSYETDSSILKNSIETWQDLIAHEVLANSITTDRGENDGEEIFKIENDRLWISVSKDNAD
jgi:isoleucyl-tRNA synthetase